VLIITYFFIDAKVFLLWLQASNYNFNLIRPLNEYRTVENQLCTQRWTHVIKVPLIDNI
jgi:hypothetical protein